jgi:hypothetical protein
MTVLRAVGQGGTSLRGDGQYVPGVCNIGPDEIAARRRAGHAGVVASIGLLAVLLLIDAPPVARWLLVITAGGAAAGYLQSYLRFCAGFGARGTFNFGPLGRVDEVADRDMRRRDRMKAFQIGLASLLIGVAVAAIAVALPI